MPWKNLHISPNILTVLLLFLSSLLLIFTTVIIYSKIIYRFFLLTLLVLCDACTIAGYCLKSMTDMKHN